jgi:hypothetical protein
MAPIRKHIAPVNVPRFTSVKLIGCPVNGRTKATIEKYQKQLILKGLKMLFAMKCFLSSMKIRSVQPLSMPARLQLKNRQIHMHQAPKHDG